MSFVPVIVTPCAMISMSFRPLSAHSFPTALRPEPAVARRDDDPLLPTLQRLIDLWTEVLRV